MTSAIRHAPPSGKAVEGTYLDRVCTLSKPPGKSIDSDNGNAAQKQSRVGCSAFRVVGMSVLLSRREPP